jgi:hypothetical protein
LRTYRGAIEGTRIIGNEPSEIERGDSFGA